MPSFTRGIGLNLLLALGIGSAWAWYHVAPPPPSEAYRFLIRTNLPGWQFEPAPVPDTAKKILATQNLFNGVYRGPAGERVTVFVGRWDANNANELSVVGHTPDVCWVGGGWKPISLGQPQQVSFTVSGQEIPFEVRAFRPPAGGSYELTVWCTVVNGRLYQELDRFTPTDLPQDDRRLRSAETARRVGAAHFLNAVRYRTEASGEKQFIRLSMPTDGAWETNLHQLGTFARDWLMLGKPG